MGSCCLYYVHLFVGRIDDMSHYVKGIVICIKCYVSCVILLTPVCLALYDLCLLAFWLRGVMYRTGH